MGTRRLLIAYAHPDDESFGLGGLIARYVSEGVEVSLICATDGAAGTVSPEHLNGYASVAELRYAELDAAAQVLGLHRVYKLGYNDSGMMGSATAQASTSFWNAPQAEVVRRVVEVIREAQPQVIITFNRYGGYGHPDHIAIQRATTLAFYAAGEEDYLTEGQAPYQPQKLYYSGISKSFIRYGITMMRLQGKNPRKLGVNADIDMLKVLENAEPAHALINIREFYPQWDAASACHKSQLDGRWSRVPLWLRRAMTPNQGFTRIHPAPHANRADERDLFAGVDTDVRREQLMTPVRLDTLG